MEKTCPNRFIPAPAGNSVLRPPKAAFTPVHPRACGEQATGRGKARGFLGSSPRLRGTDWVLSVQPFGSRFIPAPAGNRSELILRLPRSSVHPRACGEQPMGSIISRDWTGSSPRLRGTAGTVPAHYLDDRFIPAPAGNSQFRESLIRHRSVHPRACGEQRRQDRCCRGCFGSSPRLRGTDRVSTGRNHSHRFIPAPAGNRCQVRPLKTRSAVHPRACGEQGKPLPMPQSVSGSSPRLRGTAQGKRHDRRVRRFIPAPAGNRLVDSFQHIEFAVHPRACGEQDAHRPRGCTSRGSSPRLRGTDLNPSQRQKEVRFIPAPAGNRFAWRLPFRALPITVHPRACGEQVRRIFSKKINKWAVHPRACGEQVYYRYKKKWRLGSVHPRACGEQCKARDNAG